MVRHSTPHPPGGRLSGVRRSRERLGRCGGRREKHLPWRGQAVAGASAPVNVHAVLLSDNGDNGLCPREDAGNHGLVQRAEEVQKRSFCRRSFPHFFRCWKKWGRRRQRKCSRRGAKLSPSETNNALAPLPLTTARVGVGALVVFGDYQIAPIAARSTAMGRWRLTPPWYGDAACGGTGDEGPLIRQLR